MTITRIRHWLREYASTLMVLVLFVVGLLVLYKNLHAVNLQAVKHELESLPNDKILLALLFTLGGYFALIGYDWSALRYIQKKLPLAMVSLTSFLGFSLSNTIGVSWLSGGAIRYRLYSRVGLRPSEIALVTAFCTIGFGIGETLVGGTALIVQPDLFAKYFSLSAFQVQLIGSIMLGGFILFLFLRSRHQGVLTFRNKSFRLPSTQILAGQMVFSILDIGMAGATLYILLPDSQLSFFGFMAIFAIALVVGVLSHVPGGVGVFEAVILSALGPFIPLEQITAGLIAYRAVYYLAPFVLGILLLLGSEIVINLQQKFSNSPERLQQGLLEALQVGRSMIPYTLSGAIFIAGILLLFGSSVALSPDTLKQLDDLFPAEMIELSHLFGGIFGSLLIIASFALWQRIQAAIWITAILLTLGAVISLLQTLNYDRAFYMLLGLLLLVVGRKQFYRRSRLFGELRDIRWLLLTLGAMACFAFLLFFSFKATPYQNELWWQVATTEQVSRGMRTALVSAFTFVVIYLFIAIRAPKYHPVLSDKAQLQRAQKIIRQQDNPDGNFALTGDKALLFAEDDDAFIMFGIHGKSWVALGDPIGVSPSAQTDLIWEFKSLASRNQGNAVFYQIARKNMHWYVDAGFNLFRLGEEAIVDLASFTLEGSKRRNLRQTRNRALRNGLGFKLLPPPHSEDLLDQLKSISDQWLTLKNVREKSFSLGRFNRDYLNALPLALVFQDEQITAFANVLTTSTHATATIDLMRHLPEANSDTMEFLFTELMLNLQAQGYAHFSLGMVPLAGMMEHQQAPLWDRFGLQIYKKGRHFYNFEGLRGFKNKFKPEWEARYLATTGRGMNPYLTLADIAALTSGGLKGLVLK